MTEKKKHDFGGVNSLDRLKLRCYINDLTECWHWRLGKYADGRACVAISNPGGPSIRMTGRRAAVLLSTGKQLPNGWFAWGTCNSLDCVNPAHTDHGDAKAYGAAMKRLGKHKDKPKKIAALRQNAKRQRLLTDEQVAEIRASNLPYEVLGQKYGVAQQTIGSVKRMERYKPVQPMAIASVFSWRPAA